MQILGYKTTVRSANSLHVCDSWIRPLQPALPVFVVCRRKDYFGKDLPHLSAERFGTRTVIYYIIGPNLLKV